MEIQTWALSDVGRVRDHNEDNMLVEPAIGLLVVADGMGGHAAGEVASQLAVTTLRESFARTQPLLRKYAEKEDEADRRQILAIIEQSIQEACAKIYDMGQKDQKRRGMGTTTSLLLLVGRRGFIGHVGDSRVYLHRAGQVHQLTEDHSLIQELIKRGKLRKEDADKSPYRNAVTRAVGIYASVEVDTLDFDILPGDTFLLCSDGLSGYMKDDEVGLFLGEKAGERIPKALIDIANSRGGKDNITAIIARVQAEPSQAGTEKAAAANYQLRIETMKRTRLFKFFTHNDLLRLSSVMHYRRYAPNEILMREGEFGDELFLILAGQVRLQRGDQVLSFHKNGDTFGEMALVTRAPRSATVIAHEDVEVLTLGRQEFFEILKSESQLSARLLWQFVQILAERLRVTTDKLVAQHENDS
jgi:serine/threonine protein phosphatase PrpC